MEYDLDLINLRIDQVIAVLEKNPNRADLKFKLYLLQSMKKKAEEYMSEA